ncbi:hypothetical protein ACTXT7_016011 [Hymenolepis weldensis]
MKSKFWEKKFYPDTLVLSASSRVVVTHAGGLFDKLKIKKGGENSRPEVVVAAELQEYEGYWNANKNVAKLLRIIFITIAQNQVNDLRAWVTMLVIAYLRFYSTPRGNECELLIYKAMDWLRNEMGYSDVETVIENAKSTYRMLVPA